jgi:hypothetical protein
MKTNFAVRHGYWPLTLMVLFASCTMQKRVYMDGYNISWKNKNATAHIAENKPAQVIKEKETATASIANPAIIDPGISTFHVLEKQRIISDSCDLIILKTGEELRAKVTDITQDEIKYKRCDNLSGPSYAIKKAEVFMIKYPNGTKDIISPSAPAASSNTSAQAPIKADSVNPHRRTEPLGVIGFILGLIGLFISYWGLLFAILAIVFGAVSLHKIKKQPDLFKGKAFGIFSLMLGIVYFVIAAFLIAVFVSM